MPTTAYRPITTLPTHEVTNQPPPLEDFDALACDAALREALHREGAGWAQEKVEALARRVGSAEVLEWGRLANRHVPELRTFDRYGHRIDEVDFHPAYHQLMALGTRHEIPSIAWTSPRRGGYVAHIALSYLMYQAEAGVVCSFLMSHASIPALRFAQAIAAEWEPRILSTQYDSRFLPPAHKTGVTIGMAMTEKQGGSDLRANATRAVALGGEGDYELTGHKWFCSMPMSDAFLSVAYTDNGVSCFLVPRWKPDGSRNPFLIQRLKDKLGNRSNASSEIEFDRTWARLVGEEGRGIRTIMEMVQNTRLNVGTAPAAFMRLAIASAVHHCRHRSAFQRRLLQQPLMQNVLADLALESEAATAMVMRIARAFDASADDPAERSLARIGCALAKYWLNKRAGAHVHEALECHGGAGYIEESILPRLYREVPLNGIWEGSGNVICLDVLRALHREPDTAEALLAEIEQASGADRRLDEAVARLRKLLDDRASWEPNARRLAGLMSLALQGSLLARFAPPEVADAFCASRFDDARGMTFGDLPAGLALEPVIERAMPPLG